MSEETIRKEVLDNGLTVITERIDHIRSIALGIWLRRGSQDETDEDAGVYHFIEHMLFKGTRKRNAYEIAKMIDSIGGYTDAFTSKENTCFYAKMLDDHLPVVLELFSDILIDPVFDPLEIDRERKVILEEIKMVEDTPGDLVHELFLEHYWPGHPLGRPILGSVDTVNSFNQELLRDRFENSYVLPNMVIAAAGNLDHDELVRQIRKYFQLQRLGDTYSNDVPAPNPKSLVLLRPKNDLEQAHICLGTMAYSARNENRYAAGILNVILGGSMSSRLFQKIREERGLCYTVYSSMNPFDDTGYLTIYAGTSPESVHTAIELILQECRNLVTEPVSPEELQNAQNHLKGSLMLSLESSSGRMFSLAKNDMTYGRQILANEVLDRLSTITREDVQHVAMELFQHSDYGIVVVGDLQDLNVKIDEFQTH